MKKKPIKHPKMVPSTGFSAKLRDQEDDLMSTAAVEGRPQSQPPKAYDEVGPDRQGPKVPDEQKQHNNDRTPYAHGGEVDRYEEEEIDHAASIAASIMAKRKKMAKGGMINSADSIDSDSGTDMADLSRNADEDANMEDQASFNALRKENYSETAGLEQLDQPMDSNEMGHEREDDHDQSLVGAIRRKMKTRSPITR